MPSRSWELTDEDAEWLADRARELAAQAIMPIAIAVVDEGGHLLFFCRTRGTKKASSSIAIAKAWTAAVLRRPSGDYQDLVVPHGGSFGLWNVFPGQMLPVAGGQPLMFEGECIGAVGVTGGSTEQDMSLAAQLSVIFAERAQGAL
jgi:uncharacterized protein GlcG (DUF336 family)